MKATYKGKEVDLGTPFDTPEEKTKYAVYAKNSAGDVVMVRFNGEPVRVKSSDPSTPSYWNYKKSGSEFGDFKATAFLDFTTKTITSVRDGVQEYLGVELGVEPPEKIFTVYRAPGTISAIAGTCDKLPIINEHISPSIDPTAQQTIGLISSTEVVDCDDSDTDATLVLQNKANVSDKLLQLADNGKKQFSLGYLAKLREHDKYDFEQYEIEPKHLALVDSARGGAGLTFQDKEGKAMNEKLKAFLDAEGGFTAKRLAELLNILLENIQEVEGTEFKKIIPSLEKAVAVAMGSGAEVPEEKESPSEDIPAEDMGSPEVPAEEEAKDGKTYSDADFADAVSKQAEIIATERLAVIEKAKGLLSESYDFADKKTVEIMADCLKLYGDDEFADSELATAFKAIVAVNKYKAFGDGDSAADAIWDKEI